MFSHYPASHFLKGYSNSYCGTEYGRLSFRAYSSDDGTPGRSLLLTPKLLVYGPKCIGIQTSTPSCEESTPLKKSTPLIGGACIAIDKSII